MRLSIFIGLLYVAWCINPVTFDTGMKEQDYFIICLVIILGFIGDVRDLSNKGQ